MATKRSLSEPLLRAVDQALTDIRVCLPARIESYDHTTQRAEVTPLLRRAYADGETESMPVIAGVPVVWPRSGGASLTMPVRRGDGVMLVFSDRSLDRWLVQGGEVTPDDRRKHDLSDAIAIPGLYSFADQSPQDNNDDVLLQYDGSEVRLQPGGNTVVEAATSVTVNTAAVTVNADTATVTAPQTIFNGNVLINGSLTWTGTATGEGGGAAQFGSDVIANGISLTTHTHGGVETGDGSTGGPQ